MDDALKLKLKLKYQGDILWINCVKFAKRQNEATWTDTNVVEEVWTCVEGDTCPKVARTKRTLSFCPHKVWRINPCAAVPEGSSGHSCRCKRLQDADPLQEGQCKSEVELLSMEAEHNHKLSKMEFLIEMLTADIECKMKEDPRQNPLEVYALLREEYFSKLEPEDQKVFLEQINRSCLGPHYENKINRPSNAKKAKPANSKGHSQSNLIQTRNNMDEESKEPEETDESEGARQWKDLSSEDPKTIFDLVCQAIGKSNKLTKDGSTFAQIVAMVKQIFPKNNRLGLDFRTWLKLEQSKQQKKLTFFTLIQQAIQTGLDKGVISVKLKGNVRITEKYTLKTVPVNNLENTDSTSEDNGASGSSHVLEEVAEVNIKEEVDEEIFEIKEEPVEEIIELNPEMTEEDEDVVTDVNEDEEDPLGFVSQIEQPKKRRCPAQSGGIVIPSKKLKQTKDDASATVFDKFIAEKRRIWDPPGYPLPPEAFKCPICSKVLKLDHPPFVKYLYYHFKQHIELIGSYFELIEEKQSFWCKLCQLEVGSKIFSRHFNNHLDAKNVYFKNISLVENKSSCDIEIVDIRSANAFMLKEIKCIFCQEELISAHMSPEGGNGILFEHLMNNHKENFSCVFCINANLQTFSCKLCHTDISPDLFESHLAMHTTGTDKSHPEVEMVEEDVQVPGSIDEYKKEIVIKPIKYQEVIFSEDENSISVMETFGSCLICNKQFANHQTNTIFNHYKKGDHELALCNIIHMNGSSQIFFCLLCKKPIIPQFVGDHVKEHVDYKKDMYLDEDGVYQVRVGLTEEVREDNLARVYEETSDNGTTHQCLLCKEIIEIKVEQDMSSTIADLNIGSFPTIYQHYEKHREQLSVLMDLDENKEKFWCKLCKYSIFSVTFHQHLKSHMDPNQEFFKDVYVDGTNQLLTVRKYTGENGQLTTNFTKPKNMQKFRCLFCNCIKFIVKDDKDHVLFHHLEMHGKNFSGVAEVKINSFLFLCKLCGCHLTSTTFLDHIRKHITGYRGTFTKVKKVLCDDDVYRLERMDENVIYLDDEQDDQVTKKDSEEQSNSDEIKIVSESEHETNIEEMSASNTPTNHKCLICKEIVPIQIEKDVSQTRINCFPIIYQHYAKHKEQLSMLMDINLYEEKFYCKYCKVYIYAMTFHLHLQLHMDPRQTLYKNIYVKDEKLYFGQKDPVDESRSKKIMESCGVHFCDICKIAFKTTDVLDIHKRTYHMTFGAATANYQSIQPKPKASKPHCPKCKLPIDNENGLHCKCRTLPSGNAPVLKSKCQLCQVIFETSSKLEEHLRSVHFKDGIKCAFCPEKFGSVASLGLHLQETHNFNKQGIPKPINTTPTLTSSLENLHWSKEIAIRSKGDQQMQKVVIYPKTYINKSKPINNISSFNPSENKTVQVLAPNNAILSAGHPATINPPAITSNIILSTGQFGGINPQENKMIQGIAPNNIILSGGHSAIMHPPEIKTVQALAPHNIIISAGHSVMTNTSDMKTVQAMAPNNIILSGGHTIMTNTSEMKTAQALAPNNIVLSGSQSTGMNHLQAIAPKKLPQAITLPHALAPNKIILSAGQSLVTNPPENMLPQAIAHNNIIINTSQSLGTTPMGGPIFLLPNMPRSNNQINKPTRCYFCPSVFLYNDFIKHMTDPTGHAVKNIENLSKHWTCQKCEKTFISMQVLETHIKSERELNDPDHLSHRFVCNLCRTCYGSDWWTHEEHIKEFHLGPNSVIEEMCNVGTTSEKCKERTDTVTQIKKESMSYEEETIGVFGSNLDTFDDISESSIKIEEDQVFEDVRNEMENCLSNEVNMETTYVKNEDDEM